MIRLGVIGYGGRIRGVLREIAVHGRSELVAIADLKAEEIRKQEGEALEGVQFFTDADEMLHTMELDGVLVGTRCSLHSQMGARVAKRNIPLFLEKPVATCSEDVERLCNAWAESTSPVVVSFPLRVSLTVERVKEIIDSGAIGSVEQVQAVNNVPYGDVYFHNWYRDHNETGGLWLQKATHDFDYISYLLESRPRWVAAMKSQRVYGGEMPAGLRCVDCDKQEECIESPQNLFYRRHARKSPFDDQRMCLFGEEIENEDNASALLEYESGVQVSYSHNFFARNTAAARGARLLGYEGTIDFDWYRGDIIVHYHHTPRTERIEFDTSKASHFGGDRVLARNFLDVIEGKAESLTPLRAGIESAVSCMAAREASENRRFTEVAFPASMPAV